MPRRSRADDDGLALFESKVRPVLVEHCYKCHSAEAKAAGKLKGGLRLDTKDALLQGGDSGPAIEPGRADDSLLIQVIRYDDAIHMPPSGKLPDAVIADLTGWVNRGAPDPRVAATTPAPSLPRTFDLEAARSHWAYQQPRDVPVPSVRDASWPLNEIDHFLLARLKSKGLRPVPEADRATLARRLSYDLTGLPPTPEELAAFLNDPAPDAYERLVDRLLASPRFGERWGRHWLDVARFAESLTLRGFVFDEAWRYRDYVIATFNADRPYRDFVREQIAGDLLPAGSLDDRQRNLVATTFLTLGNTNLEEQDKKQLEMDVVNEQIDTLGKVFLAQTIACARCHDHKFDPIPTADYYAIAGILANVQTLEHANVSKWLERPMPLPPEEEAALAAHESRLAELEARIKDERSRLKGKGAVGVVAASDLPGVVVDDTKARKVGFWKESRYSGSFIGSGYLHDDNADKGSKSLTFEPEHLEPGLYEVRLAYSPGGSRATNVPITIGSADGEKPVTLDMKSAPPIAGRFASLGRYRFEKDGLAYVLIANDGTSGHVTADAVQFLPVEQVAREADENSSHEAAKALKRLESELEHLKADGPKRPMVMSVVEKETISETRIHIRGSVHRLGEPVPRGFLRVAAYGTPPPMPSDSSGRLQLANWLASPDNPLTARVIVNRTWHWLLGSGLVRTVDNFGTTGESPSHSELLDHLAVRFLQEDWSIKSLVRRIVLSRTYRLSTLDDPASLAADPENRLLWRHNRRRLEAEELRDSILSVSGQLLDTMGGPNFPPGLAADYGYQDALPRRSVYVPVFRNALPDLFEVFDFADPSLVVGRRNSSTVAPQALFLMNSPFVMEHARHAAKRLLASSEPGDSSRLDRAYLLTLGRRPNEAERRLALRFLDEGVSSRPEDAWAMLFQALFASIDFRHLE